MPIPSTDTVVGGVNRTGLIHTYTICTIHVLVLSWWSPPLAQGKDLPEIARSPAENWRAQLSCPSLAYITDKYWLFIAVISVSHPLTAAIISSSSPAAFLSRSSQQPFSAALLSSHSQQLFSAALPSSHSQQLFSAAILSSHSQQVFSAAILSSSSQLSSCCGQGLVVSYYHHVAVVRGWWSAILSSSYCGRD